MTPPTSSSRWQTDGKFFRCNGSRIHPRMVTYGPFPGGWPKSFVSDFRRIAAAGFDAIRTYELPPPDMLASAEGTGLKVFAGLDWQQNSDFLDPPARLSAAEIRLVGWLRSWGGHPALAAVYVGNEIPVDLVRWMGPARVQSALEGLISAGKEVAPALLFAYANFPRTEYLEPGNADFTAFNVYLEQEEDLERYLKRLHHVAGDRPLVISEFGLDSQRNGDRRQTGLLENALSICETGSAAGFTIFSWSDRWLSGGIEVQDWAFGLTDREGNDKPALAAVAKQATPADTENPVAEEPVVSAIVCTRNGRKRIGNCLKALVDSNCRHEFEIVVVDDGSTDGTAEFVSGNFPDVKFVRIEPGGLSRARNIGARKARGGILAYTDDDCEPDQDWLQHVVDFLQAHPDHAAVGGPNLPQRPRHWREAVVCAAPGAPSHVMIDDVSAEHLPGCNLVVRKSALEMIGGFDEQFHTAGDDVDFCWRLQDAGLGLGFAPGAFVWHWRRPSLRAYLRQQVGYGKAERLLIRKHPDRFGTHGSALWKGTIYTGAPLRVSKDAVIYHGTVDHRLYRPELNATQPQRDLDERFNGPRSRIALAILKWLAPALRAWHRIGRARSLLVRHPIRQRPGAPADFDQCVIDGIHRDDLIPVLIAAGWKSCPDTDEWDLKKDDTRVLIATELGEMGVKRTLVRVTGDLSGLQRELSGGNLLPDKMTEERIRPNE